MNKRIEILAIALMFWINTLWAIYNQVCNNEFGYNVNIAYILVVVLLIRVLIRGDK